MRTFAAKLETLPVAQRMLWPSSREEAKRSRCRSLVKLDSGVSGSRN
jgi:hypothetical protein